MSEIPVAIDDLGNVLQEIANELRMIRRMLQVQYEGEAGD